MSYINKFLLDKYSSEELEEKKMVDEGETIIALTPVDKPEEKGAAVATLSANAEHADKHKIVEEDDGLIRITTRYDADEEEFGKDVVNLNNLTEKAARHSGLTAAMESYVDILDNALEKGQGVSDATLKAMYMGIKLADRDNYVKLAMPGFEDLIFSSTPFIRTQYSAESFKDRLKDMIKKAIEYARRIWDALKEVYFKITKSLVKVKEDLVTVKAHVTGISENKSSNITFDPSNFKRLCVDGEFMGSDVKGVKDFHETAKFYFDEYPRIAMNIMEPVNKGMVDVVDSRFGMSTMVNGKNIGSRTSSEAYAEMILDMNDIIQKAFNLDQYRSMSKINNPRDIPPAFTNVKDVSVFKGKTLPGDYSLYMAFRTILSSSGNSTREKDIDRTVGFIGGAYDAAFAKVPNVKDTVSSKEKIPQKNVLLNIITELENIVNNVQKWEANSGKEFEKTRRTAISNIKELEDKLKSATMFAADNAYTGRVISILTNTQLLNNKITTPTGSMYGYVVSTIRAYIKFIELCANTLKKASSEDASDASFTMSGQKLLTN